MNKFHRSLLLTGIVAAGLAGCGDDVTVVDPPPPPPPPVAEVRSVTVAPDNVIVAPGGTLQMSAAITSDAGCNPATAWSSSDQTRATISTAGLVSVPAAATSGPVAIRATATCATGGSTGSGVATLNIQGATITGVTVNPTSAILPADPNARLTATATVAGTGSFNTGVDWSISNTGIVTLSCTTACPASNNVDIIPVSGASGTVQVRATSKGDPTKSAVISINVIPATVTIQSITFGTLNTPVILTNVFGQIEISLNVDPGAAPNISKVQAVIGNDVVAEQIFGSPAVGAAPSAAPQTIVLSTNTAQVAKANGLFVPVVRNGNNSISARVFLTNNSTPIVSNAIPVRMNNPDAVFAPKNLKPSDASTAVALGSGTWYRGGLQIDSINFVAFDTLPPSAIDGIQVCDQDGAATTTGSWNTGMEVTLAYDCSNDQGSEDIEIDEGIDVDYASTDGPDGTTPIEPTAFSGVTSKYIVDGHDRWNLIPLATLPTVAALLVDNVAPAVTPDEIGFVAACQPTIPTPGCWINAAYAIAGDFPAGDGSGSGWMTTDVFDLVAVGTGNPDVCGTTAYTAGLTEDPSPVKYSACAVVTDSVGNTTSVAGFNAFGFDNTSPTIAYTGTYVSDSTVVSVIGAGNINYTVQDNNAGLDVNALTLNLAVLIADAAPACVSGAIAAPLGGAPLPGTGPRPMAAPIASADNGCGDQGYYTWTGNATDRAGNSVSIGAPVVGAVDRTAPTVQAIAPQPLFGAGQDATFLFFATDSTDIAGARLEVRYQATGGTLVDIGYNITSGFGTVWDNVLTTITTPPTGFPATIPGTQVFGSVVIDTTVALLGPNAALQQVDASAFDFLPNSSAVTTVAIPGVYKNNALFPLLGDPNPWAVPGLGSTTFSGAAVPCTFDYATPTNGPTIPTRILVVDQLAAGPPIDLDVLLEITTVGNGLGVNDNPKLLSDNGTLRVYQYAISASDCPSLVTGTIRLMAVKNDVNGLPSAYLVP
jgi:hypothetical protein